MMATFTGFKASKYRSARARARCHSEITPSQEFQSPPRRLHLVLIAHLLLGNSKVIVGNEQITFTCDKKKKKEKRREKKEMCLAQWVINSSTQVDKIRQNLFLRLFHYFCIHFYRLVSFVTERSRSSNASLFKIFKLCKYRSLNFRTFKTLTDLQYIYLLRTESICEKYSRE